MVRELCFFFFFFLILSFDLCGAFFSVLCTILDLDAFYMNYELLDLPLANFQYGFIWLCLMRISCEEELSTAIYLFLCVFTGPFVSSMLLFHITHFSLLLCIIGILLLFSSLFTKLNPIALLTPTKWETSTYVTGLLFVSKFVNVFCFGQPIFGLVFRSISTQICYGFKKMADLSVIHLRTVYFPQF